MDYLTIFDELKEFINKDETKGKIAYLLLFIMCELAIIIPFIIIFRGISVGLHSLPV